LSQQTASARVCRGVTRLLRVCSQQHLACSAVAAACACLWSDARVYHRAGKAQRCEHAQGGHGGLCCRRGVVAVCAVPGNGPLRSGYASKARPAGEGSGTSGLQPSAALCLSQLASQQGVRCKREQLCARGRARAASRQQAWRSAAAAPTPQLPRTLRACARAACGLPSCCGCVGPALPSCGTPAVQASGHARLLWCVDVTVSVSVSVAGCMSESSGQVCSLSAVAPGGCARWQGSTCAALFEHPRRPDVWKVV
jgi:hypothetical protein